MIRVHIQKHLAHGKPSLGSVDLFQASKCQFIYTNITIPTINFTGLRCFEYMKAVLCAFW